MIPYSRQSISEQDIAAVVEVLRSDYLSQGETVPQFEAAVSRYCGSEYAIATSNATAALHAACLALGVGNNSIVWVAATSFVASANCARYCGATVNFIDTSPDNGLLCLQALEKKLQFAKENNCLPDVLVVVHLAGQSCDMKSISALCQPHRIAIIEDASHALGGSYEGRAVGACTYSDCAIFSFHPVKPITCGEGGMIVTNNVEMCKRARLLCNHGIVRNENDFVNRKEGAWYYEQQVLGFNFRLSDIQAALGLSQLQTLDQNRNMRDQQAKEYDRLFADTALKPATRASHAKSAWHLYPLVFPDNSLRNLAFENLRAKNYGVNIHYAPIPSQPYYRQLGFKPEDFPGSLAWGRRELSLPLHAFVTKAMQEEVFSLCTQMVDA